MNEVEQLRKEIESLKAENVRLREFNSLLQAQRKENLDIICGPAHKYALSEEEMAEQLRDLRPFAEVLAELGIARKERPL